MNLAFCLFNYFAYGGLQRDFLHIARECRQRGHEIHVYTMDWKGTPEPGFHVHIIKVKGWQNHTRSRFFIEKTAAKLNSAQHDLVIGFNKMPHLDIYYAADVCYQARIREKRGRWYRLLPRYQQWLASEKAVFARGAATEIMLIAPREQQIFMDYYQTEAERFHLLPPVLSKDRVIPPNAKEIRAQFRNTYHVAEDELLLLIVASRFKIKGLDRALLALAALPPALKSRCKLFVVGADNPAPYRKIAARLQIASQVQYFGGRDDIPDFLLAADLLIHPAYLENTGTVLLEALALGLPVLTLDICGYAHYIKQAQAGTVLPSPFDQTALNKALEAMLAADREVLRQNARLFMQRTDIYNMPQAAANIIEASVGK